MLRASAQTCDHARAHWLDCVDSRNTFQACTFDRVWAEMAAVSIDVEKSKAEEIEEIWKTPLLSPTVAGSCCFTLCCRMTLKPREWTALQDVLFALQIKVTSIRILLELARSEKSWDLANQSLDVVVAGNTATVRMLPRDHLSRLFQCGFASWPLDKSVSLAITMSGCNAVKHQNLHEKSVCSQQPRLLLPMETTNKGDDDDPPCSLGDLASLDDQGGMLHDKFEQGDVVEWILMPKCPENRKSRNFAPSITPSSTENYFAPLMVETCTVSTGHCSA